MRVEYFQFIFRIVAFMPLQKRFDRVQMIFRIIRRESHGAFQKLARLAFVADADGPAGRVAIKQSEIPLRPGKIKLRVQIRRRLEFALHFPDDFKRAQTFGARKLAEIHAR